MTKNNRKLSLHRFATLIAAYTIFHLSEDPQKQVAQSDNPQLEEASEWLRQNQNKELDAILKPKEVELFGEGYSGIGINDLLKNEEFLKKLSEVASERRLQTTPPIDLNDFINDILERGKELDHSAFDNFLYSPRDLNSDLQRLGDKLKENLNNPNVKFYCEVLLGIVDKETWSWDSFNIDNVIGAGFIENLKFVKQNAMQNTTEGAGNFTKNGTEGAGNFTENSTEGTEGPNTSVTVQNTTEFPGGYFTITTTTTGTSATASETGTSVTASKTGTGTGTGTKTGTGTETGTGTKTGTETGTGTKTGTSATVSKTGTSATASKTGTTPTTTITFTNTATDTTYTITQHPKTNTFTATTTTQPPTTFTYTPEEGWQNNSTSNSSNENATAPNFTPVPNTTGGFSVFVPSSTSSTNSVTNGYFFNLTSNPSDLLKTNATSTTLENKAVVVNATNLTSTPINFSPPPYSTTLVSQTEGYIIHETTSTTTSSLTVLSNKQNNTTTVILPNGTNISFNTTNTTPEIEYNNGGNIKITTTPKNGEQPSVITIDSQTNKITTSNSPDNNASYTPGSNIVVSTTGEVFSVKTTPKKNTTPVITPLPSGNEGDNNLVLAIAIPAALVGLVAAALGAAIYFKRRQQRMAGRQPSDDVAVGNNDQPQQPGASVIGNPSGSSLGGIEMQR